MRLPFPREEQVQELPRLTPAPIFARPRVKQQSQRLLNHFRGSRNCTEHVQQAVKPLGPP